MVFSMRLLIFIIVTFSFVLLIDQFGITKILQAQQASTQPPPLIKLGPPGKCVRYDDTKLMITVTCQTVTLTDLYNQLKNPTILNKQPNGVWLLNANITINPGATLNIDPTDTTWLKIVSDEKTLAYVIHVKGSLKIDSVSFTSWNPSTNNFDMNYIC